VISFFLKAGKIKILTATACLVGIIALVDRAVGPTVSLGVLYIFPMMLGAVVLHPWETALLAILCAYLRSRFDVPSSQAEVYLRFAFASAGYAVSGLFVTALVRNRHLVAEHLSRIQREQELRREAEEQLRVLVASSPAAILTLNRKGIVLAANHAADDLLAIPRGETLQGRAISDYLPVLADALRMEIPDAGYRTAAQCQGRREDGDIFLAHTWFSSYASPEGTRLAAIVVDISEEMRAREEQNLQQLQASNRITAAAVSHELRNLCSAISVLCTHLQEHHALEQDQDFQGLAALVKGMSKITSLELDARAQESPERISLQSVLDHLRIVIESDWKEIGGAVRWHCPPQIPAVLGDASGLLQAFLNLARNSHRAVQQGARRELDIGVAVKEDRVVVRFEDSGPGIAAPDRLFEAFQQGADGTGLGLYVSRAMVRSYGGELRFEPHREPACFVIELPLAG
jgi:PAS domain S-box-containing protein